MPNWTKKARKSRRRRSLVPHDGALCRRKAWRSEDFISSFRRKWRKFVRRHPEFSMPVADFRTPEERELQACIDWAAAKILGEMEAKMKAEWHKHDVLRILVASKMLVVCDYSKKIFDKLAYHRRVFLYRKYCRDSPMWLS